MIPGLDLDAICDDFKDLSIDRMNDAQMAEFDRRLNELFEEDVENYDENMSMFSDLCLDYQQDPKSSRDPSSCQNENDFLTSIGSPIRSKRRTKAHAQVSIPSAEEMDEIMRKCDPESMHQIDRATNLLFDVYKTISEWDSKAESEVSSDAENNRAETAFCNLTNSDNASTSSENDHTITKKTVGPTSKRSVTISLPPEKQSQAMRQPPPHPALRPTLAPAPGKVPYKHDPVTMFELYREEWKSKPTPEEQKRLQLRWKVRDYLIKKQFMPKKIPSGLPVQHPKEWSPRPYLD